MATKVSLLSLTSLAILCWMSGTGGANQKALYISDMLMKNPRLTDQIWNIGFTLMMNKMSHSGGGLDKNTTSMVANYVLDNIPALLQNENFQNMVSDAALEFSSALNKTRPDINQGESQNTNGSSMPSKDQMLGIMKHLDMGSLAKKALKNGKPLFDAILSKDSTSYIPLIEEVIDFIPKLWNSPSFQKVKEAVVEESIAGYVSALKNGEISLDKSNSTELLTKVLKHVNFPRLMNEGLLASKPLIDMITGKDSTEQLMTLGFLAKVYPKLSSSKMFQYVKSVGMRHFWVTFHRMNLTMEDLKSNTSHSIQSVISNTNKLDIFKDLLKEYDARKLLPYTEDMGVNNMCYSDTMNFFDSFAAMKPWAIKMFDSYGKLSGGVMRGNLNMIGSYDECMDVTAYVPNNRSQPRTYKTRYCRAAFSVPENLLKLDGKGLQLKLTWGICVPESCQENDINGFLKTKSEEGIFSSVDGLSIECSEKPDLSEDTSAITAIAILSFFGCLLLIGTIVEFIWTEKKNNSYYLKNIKDSMNTESNKLESGNKNQTDETKQINLQNETTKDLENNAENKESEMNNTPCENDEALKDEGSKCPKDLYEPKDNKATYCQKEVIPDDENNGPKRKDGTIVKIFTAFALQKNVKRLLSGKVGGNTVTCLNGIRFLSISWIIIGHSANYGIMTVPGIWTTNNGVFFEDFISRFSAQTIIGAPLAVDSFFMISGMLVIYIQLNYVRKLAKKLTFPKAAGFAGKYILHRMWRLTPIYMIVVMVLACLIKYFGSGPLWPDELLLADNCKTNWWSNLLYVNNFLPARKQCMTWSWFLADDMQFYIMTLLLLPVLVASFKFGLAAIALLMVAGMTSAAFLENKYGGDMIHMKSDKNAYWNNVYGPPWCRVPAYCIGMLLGILMLTRPKQKLKWMTTLVGWTISTILALFIVYIPYSEHQKGAEPWSIGIRSAYEAFARPLWASCVGWVIFACHNGSGGIVNTILSWKAFVPLSRLSYGAYLLHPIVMMTYMYSKRAAFYANDFELIYLVTGHHVITFAVAFVGCLAFETPFMALEKLIFRR